MIPNSAELNAAHCLKQGPAQQVVLVGLDEIRNRIELLDLDPIKIKLMDSEEGESWSRQTADHADLLYRRFLYLNAKYPSRSIVPSKLVDTVWHAHILDTRKYAEDCDHIFGQFLHHFPYFGMRGVEDARNLASAFDESNCLYAEEFNTSPASINSICSSPNCWGGSCGAKCNVGVDATRPNLPYRTGRVPLYDSVCLHLS